VEKFMGELEQKQAEIEYNNTKNKEVILGVEAVTLVGNFFFFNIAGNQTMALSSKEIKRVNIIPQD